ncbi:NAD(P)-dependent glycerol-3-phosphate dehydrogenase [Candidatus Bipolaricaulota bacterium]|nr:NAD(P)-dependent glycerol-3-phosphate dehydrogenase [Candidatus Bipolaricaulota bacterium]
MRVSVIGAGGWGTAFARLLAKNGHAVTLWARDRATAEKIDRNRVNDKYLPGVALPREGLEITSSLPAALEPETVVLAVPSFAVPDIMSSIGPIVSTPKVYINLAKGLDHASRATMSELIEKAVDARAIFTLSGPCHAEEVGRDMPTAVVLAGRDLCLGKDLQRAIGTARFRVYLSEDIRGVELCAAVKNVIALATGISDGLGYGDNTRGALITRGLAEMARFAGAFGAVKETLFGLAGLGDLVATCTSDHSRNRSVGVRIGQGERLSEILATMSMVVEGVYATKIVRSMAAEAEVEMPITDAVYRILYDDAAPLPLVDEIMTREPKQERVQ